MTHSQPSFQQSSIASSGSRALDVRLQSPTPLAATPDACGAATSDVGRLATSALVAGRDVAPLGTVLTAGSPQVQPYLLPQLGSSNAVVNVPFVGGTPSGSYTVSASPPGSPPRLMASPARASSPPHSLSPAPMPGYWASPQLQQQPGLIFCSGPQQQTFVTGMIASQLPVPGMFPGMATVTTASPAPLQSYLPWSPQTAFGTAVAVQGQVLTPDAASQLPLTVGESAVLPMGALAAAATQPSVGLVVGSVLPAVQIPPMPAPDYNAAGSQS